MQKEQKTKTQHVGEGGAPRCREKEKQGREAEGWD